MRKSIISGVLAILFLTTFLFAQQLSPSSTATANDQGTYLLHQQIVQQIAGVYTFKVDHKYMSQSERGVYYGLQKQLAETWQTYYLQLAAVSPGDDSYRLLAWQYRQQAVGFASKMYASMPIAVVTPQVAGRLRLN